MTRRFLGGSYFVLSVYCAISATKSPLVDEAGFTFLALATVLGGIAAVLLIPAKKS